MIMLRAWLARTKTEDQIQGIAIMDDARDDLRSLIGTIDEEELVQAGAAAKIVKLLEESYEHSLTPKVPEVLEENLYDEDTHRKKGESIII